MNRNRLLQSASKFEFEKLETRRVLDAHFLLSGSQLILNDVNTPDTLTIGENNSGTAYLFELTNGIWNGEDGNGIQGSGFNQLLVEKTAVNSLSSGIQIGEVTGDPTFDAVFESVDFSDLAGLFRLTAISIQQTEGSTLVTDNIHLDAADSMAIGNNGIFRAAGDALIQAGADIQIGREVGNGQPAAARINGAARFESGGNLEFIGNTQRLSFVAAGEALISERSALVLFGQNQAGQSLSIEAHRALISDAGTSISADELSLSGKYIQLGTSNQDSIEITGRASIDSQNGLYLAPQATIRFEEFNVNSDGFVHITLDSSTVIVGDNLAASAYIQSSGSITDVPSTTIQLGGNLMIDAVEIAMATSPGNALVAAGRATLVAPQAISIGTADVLENYEGATVTFGQLQFGSEGFVSINESDGMYLVGANRAKDFDLRSRGYLLNAPGLELDAIGIARFESNIGIFLGQDPSDTIHICGETYFTAPDQVTITEAARFTTPIYNATSNYIDINRDAASCYVPIAIDQLNEVLPDDWTYQLFDDGPDIRLVTYDANGNVANRVRFGSTGTISHLTDARNGRNLLAPSYQGEVTDRILQWTFWELGQNAVYDHPNLPAHKDRFNLTQAGTFDNLLNDTVEVDMDSDTGRLDVWSVVDNLWSIEQAPFMQGNINALTRTQVLDGGAILVRRVTMMGQTFRLGQEISVDIPYLEAWSPFADAAFNSLTTSIDAQGNPNVWYANNYNVPTYPKIPVDQTRGWAMVYDRFNQQNAATMSVVFGKDPGNEHLADGSSIEPRFFRYNSMDFDTGMVINPGLSAWNLPAGSLIDQHYLFLPGQGITSDTPVMLDGLAERLPAPQIYHPGSTLPQDVEAIANRLNQLNGQSGIATDHIGTLL